jgi:hypothetical protein
MLKISIPNNNIEERKYIVEILIGELLGLDFVIEFCNTTNYVMTLSNGGKLIVKDSFFGLYNEDNSYLKRDHIPANVEFGSNDFIVEENIPIIYGDDFVQSDNSSIVCGIDIFASSFFMLSRWEEYVNTKRDSHNRFSAFDSVAYKNKFLHRPIVNEYVEMLWNMLQSLAYEGKRKDRKFELVLTHDIDDIKYWKSLPQFVKVIGSHLIKKRSLKLAFHAFRSYMNTILSLEKDPYNTFDLLMNMSEKYNLKSHFYFMSGGTSNLYENRYQIKEASDIIDSIRKRGHAIGYHGSYNSYCDLQLFNKEKKKLEGISNEQISEGRQHYLRFEVPTTWQVWHDAGMSVDSTCGYADMEGFRCGTGDEFCVFNIITSEKLGLKERPLVFMDDTLFGYNKYSVETAILTSMEIIDVSKKYNSTLNHLTHNSYFNNIGFTKFYKTILDYAQTN